MFVVRVENDEATMYRAFRHMPSARAWASERNLEDLHCLVDIFEAAGAGDPASAVTATRNGRSRAILRGEALRAMPRTLPPASDIDFGHAYAV